jgi:hypothetical protein
MIFKIWGFQGDDYEECCLLEYKNPVRTSQETHYISATEYTRLMLYKKWYFHGRKYEDCRLLVCYALRLLELTFRRNVSSPFSFGWYLVLTLFLTRWFLSPWWWRRYIAPKHRFLQDPHGVTSQMEAFLTWYYLFIVWEDSHVRRVPLSPRHGASSGCGWKRRPPVGG